MNQLKDLHEEFKQIFDELLESDQIIELLEAGKRHPFKRKKHLGPGPRKQHNQEAKKWDCDCTYNKCKCIGKGKEAGHVRYTTGSSAKLNPEKKEYNKIYKQFHKKERNAYLKAERKKQGESNE